MQQNGYLPNHEPAQAWYQWGVAVQAQLAQQAKALASLEQQVRGLEQQLAVLKEQKGIHVEKLEYHFDMLKVERLDGALHIGVSPDSGRKIEEMVLNGQTMQGEQLQSYSGPCSSAVPPQDVLREIASEIEQYLRSHADPVINELCVKHGCKLDSSYRELMLTDIRRQLEPRIAYYVKQRLQGTGMQPTAVAEIVEEMKRDIHTALDYHLASLEQTSKEEE